MTFMKKVLVKILTRVFGTFSVICWKMSMRWIQKVVRSKQTKENVCVPMHQLLQLWSTKYAVTAHPEKFLKLVHRVIAVYTSGNVWFHKFNKFSTAESWWFIVNSQTSKNVSCLVQAVFLTGTDVFCLVYTHACSIHRFLSVVQMQSQWLPYFISDG